MGGWVGSPHRSPPAHRALTCRCQPAGCSCGVIVRCPETLLTFISVLACIALCSKSLPLKYFTWSNLQVDHDWSQACLHQLLKIKKSFNESGSTFLPAVDGWSCRSQRPQSAFYDLSLFAVCEKTIGWRWENKTEISKYLFLTVDVFLIGTERRDREER